MKTEVRIEEIVSQVKSLVGNFDLLDEQILRLRLENLVIQAQVEELQKK